MTDRTTNDCTPAKVRDFRFGGGLDGAAAKLPSCDGQVVVAGGAVPGTVRWQDERVPAAAPLDVSVSTSL